MPTKQTVKHRFETDTVGRALALVGEKWSLRILRECLFGVRRYGEFARTLRIPRPTLSARLKTLVEAGLLDRVQYATNPDRHEYRLTRMGRELFPAVVTLMRWGDKYLADLGGPPIVLRHKECGQVADSYVACAECGGEIAFHTVTPEPGPSYSGE